MSPTSPIPTGLAVARQAGSWLIAPFLIAHSRSGRIYETPVNVFATQSGVRIALTYGADSDWVKNVVAAGGCRLRTRGRELTLTDPRLVHDPARTATRTFERKVLGVLQVSDFLDLEQARAQRSGM